MKATGNRDATGRTLLAWPGIGDIADGIQQVPGCMAIVAKENTTRPSYRQQGVIFMPCIPCSVQ